MTTRPVDIQLDGPAHLLIVWSDGQRRRYPLHELQENCPCAVCAEKHGAREQKRDDPFQVIQPEEAQPLKLVSMQPVGAYAYAIQFNHGCTKGIYTFEHLRELGESLA
ncbi:MAG: DUF971 domain-containing protein [Planctomycetales bacterium]|nr:DUF971 domain-containing protein [Planctomycetales bacterium]